MNFPQNYFSPMIKRKVTIGGGENGWYHYYGKYKQSGWLCEFEVDALGNCSGQNDSYVKNAGTYTKVYDGTFRNGELNLTATVINGRDQGQKMSYKGTVDKNDMFNGTLEITQKGARGIGGLKGKCGGKVVVKVMEENNNVQGMGMMLNPMNDVIEKKKVKIGGGVDGWYYYEGKRKSLNWICEFDVDSAGFVRGNNVSTIKGAGRYVKEYSGTYRNGIVNIIATITEGIDLGQKMQYKGVIEDGEFIGTLEIIEKGKRGLSGRGRCGGKVKETVTKEKLSSDIVPQKVLTTPKQKVSIGGTNGWYQWKGGKKTHNWRMEFYIDEYGTISGSQENSYYKKDYSGVFSRTKIEIFATFSKGVDVGQKNKYAGEIKNGLFCGTIEIVEKGRRGIVTTGDCEGKVFLLQLQQKPRMNQPRMNQPMMNQPMVMVQRGNQRVIQKVNQPMMNQPMVQRVNQPMMNQPMVQRGNQRVVNQPMMMNQPRINQPMMNQNFNQPMMNQPRMNQPMMNQQNYPQPVVVNPPQMMMNQPRMNQPMTNQTYVQPNAPPMMNPVNYTPKMGNQRNNFKN